MTLISLGSLSIDVDVEGTRAAYASSPPVDPTCCNACATFLLAVKENQLPSALVDVLRDIGIDLPRPVEAWGAPDGGFLQVWWPFVENARSTVTREQPIPLGQGQTLGVTTHYPQPAWGFSPDRDVPAIEFTWIGEALRQLESRAWTPAPS
jgi:hypothetical protein